MTGELWGLPAITTLIGPANLGRRASHVLYAAATMADWKTGELRASNEQIAMAACLSRRTVIRAMKELREIGIIYIIRRSDGRLPNRQAINLERLKELAAMERVGTGVTSDTMPSAGDNGVCNSDMTSHTHSPQEHIKELETRSESRPIEPQYANAPWTQLLVGWLGQLEADKVRKQFKASRIKEVVEYVQRAILTGRLRRGEPVRDPGRLALAVLRKNTPQAGRTEVGNFSAAVESLRGCRASRPGRGELRSELEALSQSLYEMEESQAR